jgi:serine/threonine protein kinase
VKKGFDVLLGAAKVMAMRQFGGGTISGEQQQQQQSGGGCDGGGRELVLVGPVQMVGDGEKNNNKNKNKKEQVEELVEEVVRRCWRWLVSNSWVLVILLVFATMEARIELQHLLMAVELVAAALLQNVVAAVTVVCCLMSLAFIFMFGVSTGLWWRARRQKKTEEKEDLQSKMLMQIEDQLPQSSSSEVKNNPMFSPAARVMVSLSPMASGLQVGNLVKQYTLKEIVSMTNSFEKELGRGGQGIVYAAMLPAMLPGELEVPAAVKKLQRPNAGFLETPEMPMQQQQAALEKEFWVELRTISRLHHGNLVALLGYCVEGQELFLIYELMSNGSLDQHLHECDSGAAAATFLDWKARIRVAIEVAQGLEYLHRHAHPTLVHRDIKSSNILFDDDMQAKIADFGLSKVLILGHDPTASHRLRGTAGYVDPHYLRTGQAVDKNDVYSYGVLLLELITGRRAIQKKLSLVTWCKEFLTSDQSLLPVLLPRMVDRGILPAEYSLEQLQNVVKVARACLDDSPERRPSMKEVLIALYNSESKDISSSDFSFEVGYYSLSPLLQRTMLLLLRQQHLFLIEEQSARDPSFLSSWLAFLCEFQMDFVHHNIRKT